MSLSQETPPDFIDPGLADYLSRRFIEIGIELLKPVKYPVRKENPYKPRIGLVAYFDNPAGHSYDAAITQEGLWVYKSTGWAFIA